MANLRARISSKIPSFHRLGAIFVPIAAISLRGVAKKGCCSKKVNAPEHVLEHMLTCDSEYRRTESLDILMFMLI